jgi:CubicO group peptidase (beta-lactamase class C family)
LRVFASVLTAVLSTVVVAAPDEILLGQKEGYPACAPRPGPVEPRCLVGTYSRFDEVAPASKVARGAAVRELKRAASEIDLYYPYAGRENTLPGFLERNRNTGLLILHGDTVVAEHYQYERAPEHRFTSMSMAKTVVAMLVGIAMEEGFISSLEHKAELYIPELHGHPYGETTLRNLLTMSSGVRFVENHDGADHMAVLARKTFLRQGPGGVDTVLPFSERALPQGGKFSYASAETQVLGLVLRAATGRTLSEYLSEKIWGPMGAEADASWLVDGGGFEIAYAGLNATLRDWGRFGLLLADRGAVEGRQVIPEAWVKAATRAAAPHLEAGRATRFNGYGYQTWILDNGGRFALFGTRGQAIFVDPHARLVVVHTAVHASARESAPRGEQFALFFGALKAVSQP